MLRSIAMVLQVTLRQSAVICFSDAIQSQPAGAPDVSDSMTRCALASEEVGATSAPKVS